MHKCRGLDRRVRPERIVEVLRETGADIIALQEVLSVEGEAREKNQARFFSEELGMHLAVGENRKIRGAPYGNATLSRWPIALAHNYEITWRWCEPRGSLRTDVKVEDGALVHLFNIHLGTAFLERRHQGRVLVSEEVLNNPELKGARVALGDFNEWTHGLASQLLAAHLESADVRYHLRRSRTYPGVLPLVHLDHIYYDSKMKLCKLRLHKSRTSLVASDHLPLVAEFEIEAEDGKSRG
ncbi:MAG TPA: endonuclease/exonuclease/phosphatase family protein [Pyrinomonadaceae bacterium]|nr:endonuclease/exonuclease/phosphatase family protein [Pyrinomonadaceae bacterium]